jgi:hypothetical protein
MQSASTNSHLGLEKAPFKYLLAQKIEQWFLSDAASDFSAADWKCLSQDKRKHWQHYSSYVNQMFTAV